MVKVTLEVAIAFTHASVALAFCWPPPIVATKRQVIIFKLVRFLLTLNGALLLLAFLHAMYKNRDDMIMIAKLISLASACVQIIVHTSLCVNKYKRLQLLIAEMKSCYTDANSQERNIFQGYVDRYKLLYCASVAWVYISALSVVIGIEFLSQPFPRSAIYPFPVDQHPLNALTLLNYSLAAFQSAAHVSSTCLYALLLWFTVARLEILNTEFRMATNIDKLYICIRKHRRMIRYANEVSRVSRYAVVTVVGVATVGLIVSAITFVSQQQSVALKGQYVLLSLTTFLEVFLCAWPADHLMTMIHDAKNALRFFSNFDIPIQSCDVAQAAYDSQWYTQPKNFQKNILHIILKCQKPITVTVGGVMQALSLNYCGMFVTNAYSFFTTLRNTIDRKNTDET